MVCLVLFASIPMMERHKIRKTPEYIDYQRKVRCKL
jgi:hypothetical protein